MCPWAERKQILMRNSQKMFEINGKRQKYTKKLLLFYISEATMGWTTNPVVFSEKVLVFAILAPLRGGHAGTMKKAKNYK